MFVRNITKRLFSRINNVPFLNTLLRGYGEQIKAGTPEVKAFQSKITEINKLTDKEKDTFFRACINTSKDFSISQFLKSEGYLKSFPSLLIACNTRQIIHGIKDVKEKEKLLAESQKLIGEIQDPEQALTSRRFLEQAHGDLFLTEGKVSEAIEHYLKALNYGNKFFDKALQKAETREEELKKIKDGDKQTNYALLTAINVADNLSQLSTKALFSNTKLKGQPFSDQILKNALYSFTKCPQLKIQLSSYFLLKKTQFNHRIIDKKQTGQAVYNDIVNTMEQVLQCLHVVQHTQPAKSLQLLGIAAINYSSILNFLNGIKGTEAEDNIKQVISALCQVIKDSKKQEQFKSAIEKISHDMKAIK